MAQKATDKTPNKELVLDILDDQTSLFLQHRSHSESRKKRLSHNITELYRRLGENVEETDLLFYE